MIKQLSRRLRYFWTHSIQRQLILGIALIHAVLMTLFVIDLIERQFHALDQQDTQQAHSMVEVLATNASSWVLASDYVGLAEVMEAQQKNVRLKYAIILDLSGRVLGHNQAQYVGQYVQDEISLDLLSGEPKIRELVHSGLLLDMAAPILANEQHIGWARIGLDQQHIQASLRDVRRDGMIYILLAIAIGTIFAMFMGRGLTRGLKQLVNVSTRIGQGEEDARVHLDRRDELGTLARDFNLMLDNLRENENLLRRSRSRLQESEERFELAMRGANDGLWDWNLRHDRVYYSPRWKAMLGYQSHEIGDSVGEWRSRIHADDLGQVEQSIIEHLSGHTDSYENVHRALHRDGSYRWHLERGIAIHDDQGEAVRMVGTTTDITDRKRAEDALFAEKERALVTLNSIGDAVITTDQHGMINFLNPIAEQLLGWRNDEVKGTPLDDILYLVNEHSGQPIESPAAICLREGAIVDLSNSTLLINRRQEQIAIEDSAAPIRDRDGSIVGVVMVFHDVSKSREMSRRMHWMASHDSLTGLINRRELEVRLDQLIDSAKFEHKHHTFLYLDLDQFKIVNDTCGHIAGDELLKQLTVLLHGEIRESDLLARLGGDEFGVLLESCPLQQASEIAEKLRAAVKDYRFAWENKSFEIGVSIGLVTIDEKAGNVNEVLKAADLAVYAAKDLGRNRLHVYQPDDETLSRRHGEMQWLSRINHALEENRFRLFCQDLHVIGRADEQDRFEVLVRMVDEEGRIIPPGAFIPAAERYGLMPAVDRWVIEHTFRFLASSEGRNRNIGLITLNLSGTTLVDEDILDYIRDRLHHYGLEPGKLCFEITETAAISNLSMALKLIHRLKAEGCLFALDDFGSGLTSFAYLKNLPVDFLKIDGSFVKDILKDPIDMALVETINQVGHILGVKTIAEFVEDQATLDALQRMGVDYAQGFFLDKPKPLFEQD